MKKIFLALIASLTLLFSPFALFAQTDGSTGLAPDPATATAPVEPTTTQPAVTTTEPVPTTTPTPRTVQTQPAVAPVQTAPAPTPQPQAPAEPPVSLDDIKEVVDTAAENAPTPLRPFFAIIGGALGGIIAFLGLQKLLKKRAQKGAKRCPRCQGSGHVEENDVCATCKGTGKVEEEQELSAECARCEGEGKEPCPECDGEGKIKDVDCAKCAATGSKKDEDDEDVDCSLCRGEGEVSVTVKRDVPCPDCK